MFKSTPIGTTISYLLETTLCVFWQGGQLQQQTCRASQIVKQVFAFMFNQKGIPCRRTHILIRYLKQLPSDYKLPYFIGLTNSLASLLVFESSVSFFFQRISSNFPSFYKSKSYYKVYFFMLLNLFGSMVYSFLNSSPIYRGSKSYSPILGYLAFQVAGVAQSPISVAKLLLYDDSSVTNLVCINLLIDSDRILSTKYFCTSLVICRLSCFPLFTTLQYLYSQQVNSSFIIVLMAEKVINSCNMRYNFVCSVLLIVIQEAVQHPKF